MWYEKSARKQKTNVSIGCRASWRRGRDCRAVHKNPIKSGISCKPNEAVCTSLCPEVDRILARLAIIDIVPYPACLRLRSLRVLGRSPFSPMTISLAC